LPFATGEFTAVLCTTAFHHFAEPEHAVREIARVLAPGGRIVIGDLNAERTVIRALDLVLRLLQRSHGRFHRAGDLARGLAGSGFSDPSVRTLWNGGYALVRAQRTGP